MIIDVIVHRFLLVAVRSTELNLSSHHGPVRSGSSGVFYLKWKRPLDSMRCGKIGQNG
jgi:hypothetical protein